MGKPAKGILFFLLAVAGLPALAGAELVFEDGQVLAGVQAVRKGDQYLLELESGAVISIPAELVKQVRLTGGDKYSPEGLHWADPELLVGSETDPAAPNAIRFGEPETLAGRPEAARPPRRTEQLRVLGEPAGFREDLVEGRWYPSTDWDFDTERQNNFDPSRWAEGPVDPGWIPRSAYEAERDVFAGSRARWSPSVLDPEWVPRDGFERRNQSFVATSGPERPPAPEEEPTFRGAIYAGALPPRAAEESRAPRRAIYARALRGSDKGFGVFTVERIVANAPPPPPVELPLTPGACARRLHPALGEAARRLDDPALAALPMRLYEATGLQDGRLLRAVFSVVGEECRLIAGDLPALLGVEMTQGPETAYSANAFNSALTAAGGLTLDTDEQKIAYVRAVAELIDPAGADRLLLDRADLDDLLGERAPVCLLGRRALRREVKSAKREFRAADSEIGASGDTFVFHTWSRRGGELARYSVFLSPDGKVAVQRTVVAAHLGEHLCGF